MNITAINTSVQISDSMLSILLNIYSEMELLDRMVIVWFVFFFFFEELLYHLAQCRGVF